MEIFKHLSLLVLLCLGAEVTGSGQILAATNAGDLHQRDRAAILNVAITGRIADAAGNGLSGVSIKEKGTTNGTTSREDGSFSLSVSNQNAVLVLSSVGFQTKEIVVGNRSSITIQLESSAEEMQQVVVVGYGTQKRENIIGSISQVSAAQLRDRPVTQLSNALAGQMAGVTVIQRTGQPGASAGVINVRGVGSFGATSGALVIVDGIPGTMDNIDPNDVESISVLKDASSAAIYGSRAANGVILVTTKSGRSGTMKISYNGYTGFQQPTAFPQYVDSWDYARMFNEAAGLTYTEDDIRKYRDGSDPDNYPNTNFLKAVFSKSGLQTSHNLSISSGSANTQYNLSFGYLFQDGLVVKNNYNRYNIRLNMKSSLNSKLDLTTRLSAIKANDKEPAQPATLDGSDGVTGIINTAVRYPSTYAGRLSNGYFGTGVVQKGTPISFLESESFLMNNSANLNANVRLDYKVIPGVKLSLVSAFNQINTKRKVFSASQIINQNITLEPNELRITNSETQYYTLQGLAEYSRQFGIHHVSALAGYSFEDNVFETTSAYRNRLPGNELTQLNVGSPDNQQSTGTGSEWALESFFGRLNYSYANKYLVEGVIRRDGSSRFPASKKFAYFPSAAVGYRISQERFIQDNFSWISELKLKASLGVLGNQNIPNYPYQNTYILQNGNTTYSYPFGGSINQGVARITITDPNLHWESTRTKDVGVELGAFKNKLTLSATYFDRYTYDILFSPGGSVSNTLGFNLSKQNTGKLSNKGWEFLLGHNNHVGSFNYKLNANFSIINNKVLDLGVGNITQPNGMIGNGSSLFIGSSMQVYYGYIADGMFTDADDVKSYFSQTAINPSAQPGDIRYKDISGPDGKPDGKVDATYDRVILGSNIPKYTFGLTIGLDYKGFDFSMLLQGVGGTKNYMAGYAGIAFNNFGSIQRWQMEERWTKENPRRNAGYPRLEQVTNAGTPNTLLSSYWVLDGSYLRGKNVQVGYTLPASVTRRMRITGVRIYASGENLFLVSNYRKGWDPEVGTDNAPADDSNSITATGDYYPLLRNYTFGLNINF